MNSKLLFTLFICMRYGRCILIAGPKAIHESPMQMMIMMICHMNCANKPVQSSKHSINNRNRHTLLPSPSNSSVFDLFDLIY